MFVEIRTALAFLTLLPVGPKEISSLSLVRCAAFFPLAGWLIGLMLIFVTLLLLAAGLDALPVAVLLVGLEAWLTRGLHLDGVADLLDGSGGSFDRSRRLAIMKDSAIGAFGVVGLVVTLGLKIAALSA
ncbi:MAG: adenosylcobinamide-GDP ribazoletransferase, partial [Desulfobulbaceae bacterium]|nr:adenosylcobinamide-GDP ribazoletransferase [Desulfobulbaceae bacterium]